MLWLARSKVRGLVVSYFGLEIRGTERLNVTVIISDPARQTE